MPEDHPDKMLKVSHDLHRRLKNYAEKNGRKLAYLTEEWLEKSLREAREADAAAAAEATAR